MPTPLARTSLRSGSTVAALSLLASIAGLSCGTNTSTTPPQAVVLDNLLVVTIDTLRADHVGANGYGRDTTPNIDRLAGRGAVLTQAIAQSSWTRASMASMLTGLYPTTVGVTCHNFRMPQADCDVLPAAAVTLAEAAAERGLATAAVLANINVDPVFGFDQGFDDVVVVPSKLANEDPEWRTSDRILVGTTTDVTEAALTWLDGRSPDDRFLLYLHYLDPHDPYDPPEPHRSAFDPDGYTVDPRSRQDVARYDAEIQHVDRELQRVFDQLERAGLAGRTGVVILSDHGEEFREHGGTHHGWTMYDEQIRVPLIMTLPGLTAPGTRFDQQVRLLDVMPTLLDALGIPHPEGLEGQSLMPAFLGGRLESRPALSEWGYRPLVAWREPPWKLIVDTETRGALLFHVERDPGEKRDLFHEHGDVVGRLYDAMTEEREAAQARSERYARDAAEVPLTPEQQEQLRSLGYL